MPDTYIIVGRLYHDSPLPLASYATGGRKVSVLVNHQLNQENAPQGFPRVYNHLLRAAFNDPDCQYVWILGDDVLPDAGCLEATQAVLEADPTIGIIFPVETWVEDGRTITILPFVGGKVGRDEAATQGPAQIDQLFAGFACACLRREVWEAVGEMDEALGIGYCEDLDFGLRTWRAGWKIVNYRRAFFLHGRGATYNRLVADGVIDKTMPTESARRCKEKWPFLWPDPKGRTQEDISRETLAMLRQWYAEAHA